MIISEFKGVVKDFQQKIGLFLSIRNHLNSKSMSKIWAITNASWQACGIRYTLRPPLTSTLTR